MTRDRYTDLSPADRARAMASDANLAGIVAGRLRVARRLLAPPGPKRTLVGQWAARLHPDRPSMALPAPVWVVAPDVSPVEAEYDGRGVPAEQDHIPWNETGATYVDLTTLTVYRQE